MCGLTPDFDRRAMGFSPNRADALVWALADLLGVGRGGAGGCMNFGRKAAVNLWLKRPLATPLDNRQRRCGT